MKVAERGMNSGTGTNLKVGHRSGAKVGAPIWREVPGNFFWSCPSIFDSKSTISRFGERFCDGQYSLVSFLLTVLLLTVPPPVHSHL